MKKAEIYDRYKNSKVLFLLFFLIVMPKFVFAVSLFDDCGFIKYEDIEYIQKNGNILKCEPKYFNGVTTYYLLSISDFVQQYLIDSNINTCEGKKSDKGYLFSIEGYKKHIGDFELVQINNRIIEFFDFSTVKVILGELLQKSEEELVEICAQHVAQNGKTGQILPLQYYLALGILSEDHKYQGATEKLKQLQIEAEKHQEFVLGGSFDMNRGIRMLLETYKTDDNKVLRIEDQLSAMEKKIDQFALDLKKMMPVENLKNESKNEIELIKEKIDQFYKNSLNNGAILPYAYYEMLKKMIKKNHFLFSYKENNEYTKKLQEEAELAIESPDFIMGGSLVANKKIRELLWKMTLKDTKIDDLYNEEDLCNKINPILNLLNHRFYKTKAKELLLRNAEDVYCQWSRDPYAGFAEYLQLASLLLPYSKKPNQPPISFEDYGLLAYHAIITQNDEQIKSLQKLAEETFVALENIGAENFDLENPEHEKCFYILERLSPLIPEHKFTLFFYNLLKKNEYDRLYSLFVHNKNYAAENPDVIMGQNDDENTKIRLLLNKHIGYYSSDEDCSVKLENEDDDNQYDEVNENLNNSDEYKVEDEDQESDDGGF